MLIVRGLSKVTLATVEAPTVCAAHISVPCPKLCTVDQCYSREKHAYDLICPGNWRVISVRDINGKYCATSADKSRHNAATLICEDSSSKKLGT